MIAILNVRESTYTPAATGAVAVQPIPVLAVNGRLDASTVSILDRAIMRALLQKPKVVIIDLGEVTYISSSGLRILLTARRQIRERGGDIYLCVLSSSVRDVFNMVGFSALFNILETLEAAKEAAGQINSSSAASR